MKWDLPTPSLIFFIFSHLYLQQHFCSVLRYNMEYAV